jgi:hypothetical protein
MAQWTKFYAGPGHLKGRIIPTLSNGGKSRDSSTIITMFSDHVRRHLGRKQKINWLSFRFHHRCEGGVFFRFFFYFFHFGLLKVKWILGLRVKGVMGDPPLFEDLSSNNRARRIDFLWARSPIGRNWQTIN